MSALKGTILLTGANGGLGSGFVSNLISFPYVSNYRAIYTVRNPLTSHDLQAILAKAPKSHVSETIALDLSTLSGVRKVAAEINAKVSSGEWEPIRALVLNAAWQEANSSTLTAQTYTEDGYEAHFAINYLANFLFVLLLLESMDKEHGRIVMVSSFAHDANDLRGVWKEQEYKIMFPNGEDGVQKLAKGLEYKDDGYKGGMRRYGASKLLLVMLMYVFTSFPSYDSKTDAYDLGTNSNAASTLPPFLIKSRSSPLILAPWVELVSSNLHPSTFAS
jgi:NAD(P)-dependent dehydrogenase (short-subunit alcohol dehydrogenase family)